MTIVAAALVIGAAAVAYLAPQVLSGRHVASNAARRASAAGVTPPSSVLVYSAAFADSRDGAVSLTQRGASSGGLYTTHDGGRSWQKAAIPAPGTGSVTYFDPRDAVLVGNGTDVEDAWTTGDGGNVWTVVPLPAHPSGPYVPAAPMFSDTRQALLIRQLGTANAPVHPVEIWRTQDGGLSWTRRAAAGIPVDGYKSLIWFDGERALLLVAPADGAAPSVLFTADGGDSWRLSEQVLVPQPGTGAQPPPTATVLRSGARLVLWTTLNGRAPDEAQSRAASYAAVSQDAGADWGPLQRQPDGLSGSPVPDGHGRLVVLRGDRLWASSDAAHTWSSRAVHLPAGADALGLLSATSDELFAVAAYDPTEEEPEALLYSRDAGDHWLTVTLPAAGR